MPLELFFEDRRRAALAQLPTGTAPVPSVAGSRAGLAASLSVIGPGPEVANVENRCFATRSGELPLRLIRPENVRGVMLHVHGGGWVAGGCAEFEPLARALASACDCLVVLPEYRLAPEHPFPAGLEDVEDTLAWAADFARALGLPLILSGDSAGANLMTAAILGSREAVEARLAVLAYPVSQADFTTSSYIENGERQLLTTQSMRMFFENYAPPELWNDPRISVLHHLHLDKMPRTFVLTAQHDVLRDDGSALVAALLKAGVAVEHRNYDMMPHGFLPFHGQSPIAAAALADIAAVAKSVL